MSTPALFERDRVKKFTTPDPVGLLFASGAVPVLGFGLATQWAAYRLGFHLDLPGLAWANDLDLIRSFTLLAPALFAGAAGLLGYTSYKGLGRRWWGMSLLLAAFSAGLYVYSFRRLYAPWNIVLWSMSYWKNPTIGPYLREAVAGGGIYAVLLTLSIWLVAGSPEWRVSDNFGSAKFGDGSWFSRGKKRRSHGQKSRGGSRPAENSKEFGLPIGWKSGRMHYDRSGLHALIIAPTGSGKTVGFAIPALLLHRGSALAIDIKRELYHVTARRRKELNEGRVFRLDPFGDPDGPDQVAFNPMDLLDTRPGRDTMIGDDAKMIAEMCIVETGKENNPFFVRSARQLLTGLILEVAHVEPRQVTKANLSYHLSGDPGDRAHVPCVGDQNPWRSLIEVRRLLTKPDDELRQRLKKMSKRSPGSERYHKLSASIGAQFADMNKKEFTAVVSTAREQTFFLESPAIARVLETTTVDLELLKRQLVTLYLVLPDDRLETYNRWLRLVIACAQTAVTRVEGRPGHSILFMIDEFPALGRFQKLSKGVSLHRHYGIQYVLIAQTKSQLIDRYGELADNLIANTQNRIVWAANDRGAADMISSLSGKMTVAVKGSQQSKSRGKGQKGGFQRGVTETVSERGRPLVTSSEALRLPSTHCFVFTRGQHPLVARRPDYLEDALFDGLYDENPAYEQAPSDGNANIDLQAYDHRFKVLTGQLYEEGRGARDRFWVLCQEKGAFAARNAVLENPALLGALAGKGDEEADDPALDPCALRDLLQVGRALFQHYQSFGAQTQPNGEEGGSPSDADGKAEEAFTFYLQDPSADDSEKPARTPSEHAHQSR